MKTKRIKRKEEKESTLQLGYGNVPLRPTLSAFPWRGHGRIVCVAFVRFVWLGRPGDLRFSPLSPFPLFSFLTIFLPRLSSAREFSSIKFVRTRFPRPHLFLFDYLCTFALEFLYTVLQIKTPLFFVIFISTAQFDINRKKYLERIHIHV